MGRRHENAMASQQVLQGRRVKSRYFMIAPRLSRGLCLLVGLGLLAGACSHKPAATTTPPTQSPSSQAVSPTVAASPTATVATTAAPPASAAPAPTTKAPTTKAPPTPTGPALTTPAAAPSTAAGAPLSLPRLGTYVYDLSGTTQSPLLGIPQAYQPGATLSVDIYERNAQADGTEIGSKGTSSQDQVQTTTKQVYQASKVLLTFTNLTFLGLASYDCSYAPPPEVLPVPLEAVTIPTQSWSGPQCSGSLQLSVQGAERVTAAGQTWNAWRVHTVLHYVAQSSVDATLDTTSLVSPELGTAVTSDSTTSGKVAGSAFKSHQVTSLRSHP
ncbi:MAG: hypothetical protein QOH66_1534 [Actinomycetota bacterium]|nr:hypothetical protein [Actinomycetota bacterium]